MRDVTPEPPQCPDWCEVNHRGHWADEGGGTLVQRCERVMLCGPVRIVLERFSDSEGGDLHIGDTVVRVNDVEMPMPQAAGVATAIAQCVRISVMGMATA